MNSVALFERAQRVIPGGVNSPVRAFQAVGGTPVYVCSGAGARMITADGATLTDFCGSWGPLILGHARPEIVAAVCEAARAGTTFGINTPQEVEFAELLCALAPDLAMVRLTCSGTEAVMTALRLARGATGRRHILKFDGCYHGHVDCLLVAAGSGLLTGGAASSAGVSAATAAEVFVARYNDLDAVREIVDRAGNDLAAIIVEPVAANMGLVQPQPGFLEGLRAAADQCEALLIFDEVITGFRLGPTTYGRLRGIVPDLTCLGKIVGGGMPIGAVGGRADLMRQLAPTGPVYQAGTLSGNPVAVAAGLTQLALLRDENPYPALNALGERLADGLNRIFKERGTAAHCARLGSLFTPFFCPPPLRNLEDVKRADTAAYAVLFHGMLDRGFYLPPSQFEVGFVSAAHTKTDIDGFLAAADATLAAGR